MAMLGPFFASRVPDRLPSKLRHSLNAEDVRDSYERLFAVMTALMARGYPNAEVDLGPDEKDIVRRTFASVYLSPDLAFLSSKIFFSTQPNSREYVRAGSLDLRRGLRETPHLQDVLSCLQGNMQFNQRLHSFQLL